MERGNVRGMRATRGTATWGVIAAAVVVSLLLPTTLALQNLTGLHISATSQRAGDTETWTVKFQNPVATDIDGYRLKWTVPEGFVLDNPTCSFDGPGSIHSTTVSGRTVTCKISSTFVGQGATLVFRVTNVRAPTSQQTTPHFTTEWANNAGVTVVSDDEYTTQILNNYLQSVSAALADARTGVVTTLNLGFSTKNPVAANGDVRFVLPSGFELQSNAACSIAGLSGLTFTRVSATEGVCNLGSATLAAGTAYTVAVSGVKNALYAKSYQVVSLQTRTATDALHDTAANIALSLTPRPFAQAPKATPGSNVMGAVTWWDFEGKLSNPLPANDYVAVTFPQGFTFNRNGTTAFEVLSGTSGHFDAAFIMGQTVAARLADSVSLSEGTLLKWRVLHIENAPVPDSRRGDPNATQTVEFLLATANDAATLLGNIKDLVQGLLIQPPPPPCDPETEDCCEVDSSACGDSGCGVQPIPTGCCQEANTCPNPSTCAELGTCPTQTPPPPSPPSPDRPDDGDGWRGGKKIYNFFAADGPLGSSGGFVAGLLALLLVGGLGAGGYHGYRFLQRQQPKPKQGGRTDKPSLPQIRKLKP